MKIRISNQRGIAAVESLITLPILILILTVIVEFGSAYIRYNTLSKSVQNAVRFSIRDVYGTFDPYSIADTSFIKNMVVYGKKVVTDSDQPILNSFTTDDVTVTYDSSDEDEKYVVVTASYTYVPILNFLSIGALADLTMSSSAVMRAKP